MGNHLPRYLLCILLPIAFGCRERTDHRQKIFRYNQPDGIATLDPAFAKNQAVIWAVHQIFNTLVEVDDSLQIKPGLAHSWDVSANRLCFTFHLRNNVYFHDDAGFTGGKGRKLVASDVVYSFSRIMSPRTASPGAWIFNDRVDKADAFSAPDDSTFCLILRRPFQPILGMLSMQYCSILPREIVERYGADIRRHPIGTGPFQFTAWEEGQALILKRNPNYFEKDSSGIQIPYLDGIKVSFFESKASEFLEFRQHRLDFINDIDLSFKDELLTRTGNLRSEWRNEIILHKQPYLNTEYLGIRLDSLSEEAPALQIKKLRQAIASGINRKKMILYLRNSIGTAAESGFIPQGLPSFNVNAVPGYRYDPVQSRRLLAESRYVEIGAPLITLTTVPNYASLGNFIANELKQIGINVKIDVMQKSLLLDQTSRGLIPFFRGSWIADYPDAENYLSVCYGRNPAPPNYTHFKNKIYDSLYETALAETNDSLRYKLYREMDRIIINEVPLIPLWYDMVLHLVHNNIKGFTSNSQNMLELRRVRKQ